MYRMVIVPPRISVLDALRRKHPEPKYPPDSAPLSCDKLPSHIDGEVTGAHIKHTASHIQGSAGPSGTDSNHWQDVLLQYGGS